MTLSILDINRKGALRRSYRYIFVTLFLIFFSFVYELKGHGVYSNYMLYCFVPSLLLGVVLWFVVGYYFKNISVYSLLPQALDSLVATLTIGMIFRGVLDIYGTTSRLCIVFVIASVLLAVLVLVLFFISRLLDKEKL